MEANETKGVRVALPCDISRDKQHKELPTNGFTITKKYLPVVADVVAKHLLHPPADAVL